MPLSIRVDREKCMGSGNCAFHAPNTFDLDDEMKAIVVEPAANSASDPDDKIRLAVDGCPTLALSIDE
jgi:ferredoxin